MKNEPALQIFLSIIMTFILCNPAFAIAIDNLYTAAIQVTDNTITTRTQILPQAFEKVVRRVASSHQATTHPEYLQAKQHVDEYLNTYFYNENSGTYTLTLQFNEQKITNLLNKMGRHSFNKNRPQILLWLILEQNNQPNFVTNSSQSEIATKIDILANSYGLPVLFPLLDLTERLFISEQDAINFNVAPLQQASGRYNADGIMIGKVNNINGIWHCEWRLVSGQQNIAWNTSGDDLDVELEVMFNQLADNLITGFGKMSPVEAAKPNIAVRVKGVNSVADYARVLSYLKKLPIVHQVEIGSVEGNQAIFIVVADGGKEDVIKALHADNVLNAESEIDATLIYRISS